jgi:nicotinamide-nucleotide adenylyltransferase
MHHLERAAIIGRWRPVHEGHAVVLRCLCGVAGQVVVGIGSANRYDWRNPFTLDEVRQMLRCVLDDRHGVEIVALDDLGDGPRWRELVKRVIGPVDVVFTANPYVRHLLAGHYRVEHPVVVVPQDQRAPVEGAMVRRMMARGEAWDRLVPAPVAELIRSRGLAQRFRNEFGLETLARTLMYGRRRHVLVE